MKNKNKTGKPHKTLFLFVFSILFFSGLSFVRAADPELIITWKADNFYPASYAGKAIPSFGTKVYFAVEAIQDGKLLDISKALIEWRKNGERIRRGEGQKEALVVFNETDQTSFVSASVSFGEKTIEKNVSIPIISPKLVLEIPYLNNVVPKNTDISILAMPYFFNAKSFNDFSFSWQIGGLKKGTGSDNKIIINTGNPRIGTDQLVTISGYIQNKRSLMEIVKTQAKLFIGE